MAGWLDGGLSARDVYIFAACYWSARESLHVRMNSLLGLSRWFCSCGERSRGWRLDVERETALWREIIEWLSSALVRKVHDRAFCIPAPTYNSHFGSFYSTGVDCHRCSTPRVHAATTTASIRCSPGLPRCDRISLALPCGHETWHC